MIGSNELVLNKATMMQALQEWLDKRMPNETPQVRGIRYNVGEDVFEVSVVELEKSDGN